MLSGSSVSCLLPLAVLSACQLQIAPMLNGRIDIRYRRVECTPPVPVKVQIDGNSGPGGWLRLSVTVSGLHCVEFPALSCNQPC